MAILNEQTTVTTSPATAAGTPPAAVARVPLGVFGTRLAATPRATPPGQIPPPPPAAVVTPPAAPIPPVVAPADAARASATADPIPPAQPPTAPAPPVLGKGGAPIPPEAVSERVTRERNRILRAEYGTADAAEIAKIKARRQEQADEYTQLKTKQEEAERQALTEQQRQAADLEKERAKTAELQARITEMETGQVVQKQTQEITGLATKYIDPTMLEYALSDFQRYVSKLDPKEVKRITPRSIEKWFEKLAETKPRFRIVVEAPAAEPPVTPTPKEPPPAKVVRKVPITTSMAKPGGPPKPAPKAPEAGTIAGKTVRPGQPNSMTPAEVKAHMRSLGRKPW